jgi:hypothetical protein
LFGKSRTIKQKSGLAKCSYADICKKFEGTSVIVAENLEESYEENRETNGRSQASLGWE